MILETAFPPDARVEREALALVSAGYEVTLLCQPEYPEQALTETYQGITVLRISLKKRWWDSLQRLFQKTEPAWARLIRSVIAQQRPDVIHVHDLKLLRSTLHALPAKNRPKIIADLHENFPVLMAQLKAKRKGPQKGQTAFAYWQNQEAQCLPQVDHILVVETEAKARVVKEHKLSADKISIIRNVVDTDKFLSDAVSALTVSDPIAFKDKFVLCYVGHINSDHRGIHTVLEALPEVIKTIPNVLFVGAGTMQSRYFEQRLKPLIEAHQLEPYVLLTGTLDESEFAPYIKAADIGLCPHTKTTLTDTTFPNKVFLYNLFAKPLITSNCVPLVRYIDETQSGLVFESENAPDLAAKIIALYHNPLLQKELGCRGRECVFNQYSWAHEQETLRAIYQHL